jgi:hypothetical protein
VIFVFEILMLCSGVATLVRGRIALFGYWVISGAPARLIGFLLATPFTTGFVLGAIRGWKMAQAGKQFTLDAVADLAAMELMLMAGCGAMAGLIAVVSIRRPSKQVNELEEWKRLRQTGPLEMDDALRS